MIDQVLPSSMPSKTHFFVAAMRAEFPRFRLRRVVVRSRIQRLRGELLLQLAESEVFAELDQKLHHFVGRFGDVDACELFMGLIHR